MLGISANDECLNKFEKLKMNKKIAYQIYAIDGKDIVCEESVEKAEVGDDQKEYTAKFIAAIKEKGYVLYFCVNIYLFVYAYSHLIYIYILCLSYIIYHIQ